MLLEVLEFSTSVDQIWYGYFETSQCIMMYLDRHLGVTRR